MMHQQTDKNLIVYLFFFIVLSTFHNLTFKVSNFFKINSVEIIGFENPFLDNFKSNIYDFYDDNIFFIERDIFNNLIASNTLVENFHVFKKYPSKLQININKTNFLAKKNIDGENFLVGSNGKLTKYFLLNDELPFIFGNPDIDEVLKLNLIINNSKFKYDDLKNLYYYKSGRWDVETKKNILIKLPKEDLANVLETVFNFQFNQSFKNYKIIDARIKNQIILYD